MLKGLRNLFSGGDNNQQSPRSKDSGAYYYVRVYRMPGRATDKDEIVQVRIDMNNDLSRDDDGALFVRKNVTGPKTFARTEARFFFDTKRVLVGSEVDNGEVVKAEDYQAYLDQFGEDKPEAE